jgi:hypothetical protein
MQNLGLSVHEAGHLNVQSSMPAQPYLNVLTVTNGIFCSSRPKGLWSAREQCSREIQQIWKKFRDPFRAFLRARRRCCAMTAHAEEAGFRLLGCDQVFQSTPNL